MAINVKAKVGETFLDVVLDNELDLDELDGYGACEGQMACSTCLLNFSPEDFNKTVEDRKVTDDELDMIDTAKGRTDCSRLGCQVKIQPWMDGIKV